MVGIGSAGPTKVGAMDWYEVVERDHEIQNPLSAEKVRLLGDYLRLGSDSRVLDIACGKAGPAIVLAQTYGCHVSGIESRPAFADEARARIAAAGLGSLIEIQTADAATVPFARETWDAALCLGATFVWGTMADAASALVPAVHAGGFVAIGEPYWKQWPSPDGIDPNGYVSLQITVDRFEQAGVALTGLIAASEDDWNRYESLHWRAVQEWLAEHADHPSAGAFVARHSQHQHDHLAYRGTQLGWAVFAGRKPT